MNEEDKILLNEIQKTVDENQKILKGIRSHHRFATFFKITYWLIIIAIVFGAYYFAKPVLDSVGATKNSLLELKDRLPETKLIESFLEKSE